MRPQRNNAKRSAAREAHRQRIAAYMASPAWAKQRAAWVLEYEARNAALPTCAVCNAGWVTESGATLDVHHHTYERLGKELFDDLVALCREHHEHVHRAFDSDSYWRRMDRPTASRELINRLKNASTHV